MAAATSPGSTVAPASASDVAVGTGNSIVGKRGVDAHADDGGRPDAPVHPLGEDAADLAVVDQHVVGPLQFRAHAGGRARSRRRRRDRLSSGQPQPARQTGTADGGRSSTEIASEVPGGASQTRVNRPRPVRWWSATSTWPDSAPARAAAARSALVEPVVATVRTFAHTDRVGRVGARSQSTSTVGSTSNPMPPTTYSPLWSAHGPRDSHHPWQGRRARRRIEQAGTPRRPRPLSRRCTPRAR